MKVKRKNPIVVVREKEDCLADGDEVPVSAARVVSVDTLSVAVGE